MIGSCLQAAERQDNLIGTSLPIDIPAVDKISVSDCGSGHCSLCLIHIFRGEDVRLGLGAADGNENLLMGSGILDMKCLHAVWPWKRRGHGTIREGAGGIELEIGAVVISAFPRQLESASEEILHGVHAHEIREMQADNQETAIFHVCDHFLKYLSVGPFGQAFVRDDDGLWVVLFQEPYRTRRCFGALQATPVGKLVDQ